MKLKSARSGQQDVVLEAARKHALREQWDSLSDVLGHWRLDSSSYEVRSRARRRGCDPLYSREGS